MVVRAMRMVHTYIPLTAATTAGPVLRGSYLRAPCPFSPSVRNAQPAALPWHGAPYLVRGCWATRFRAVHLDTYVAARYVNEQ